MMVENDNSKAEADHPSGDYEDHPANSHEEGQRNASIDDAHDDENAPKKTWMGSYMDDLTKDEVVFTEAPRVLPWRIGLFLLTSTITQNLSYVIASFLTTNAYAYPAGWTTKQQKQFNSLVYTMAYLGPVFGLAIDLVRVLRERFRPVIIIACVVNAVVGFVSFGVKGIEDKYGACLMLSWIMEVAIMFIYIPMNAVVINYGNRVLESSTETTARVGGLMAQAMVWRTSGTVLYTIFFQLTNGYRKDANINYRWYCLIAAIASCVLILQVIFLTKRAYYTDYRKASFKNAQHVRFLKAMNIRKKAVSRKVEATGGKFMFILCFTLIYFFLPDPLYNTKYSFEYQWTATFSKGLSETQSILAQVGALLGAVAYAVWMYVDQYLDSKKGRIFRAVPFVIVLAGCTAWAFGIFFHFFGVMGKNDEDFDYKVFITFEAVIVYACLRFAFMPSLSLAALHAPRFFEATAYELYSVASFAGGALSSPITTYFMTSLGVSVSAGYWKAMLLFIVFRFVPVIIGFTLPKYREDETIPVINDKHEPLDEMDSNPDAVNTEPFENEASLKGTSSPKRE